MISANNTPSPGALPIIQVGAGGMGRTWINAIKSNSDVELVGLVDLDTSVVNDVLSDYDLPGVVVGTSISEILEQVHAEAVVNVTVPEAHLPVNKVALENGFPVLCEKPAAPTVSTALIQAAIAEQSGSLLMISQSRRYFSALREIRRQTEQMGDIGAIVTNFFKAPRFGGFREQMEHVLLVDMAIHSFDAARMVMNSEPVSVYCQEYNPEWSWFSGAANASAVFEFEGGARYMYNGSWCAPGQETSWNGSWRVSTAEGTILWDGDGDITIQKISDAVPQIVHSEPQPEEIAGSLAAFVTAVRTGERPENDAVSNIRSLAMVEAAVLSARQDRRVWIDDAIEQALIAAATNVDNENIKEWLRSEAPALLSLETR